MTIGEYLKDYRAEKHISQRKLADQCGLSNSLISMLEKGENPNTRKPLELSIRKYKAIARGTGITVERLFEILGPDAPVLIENPSILSLSNPPAISLAESSLMEIVERRANQHKPLSEDEELWMLWRNASQAAKQTALSVLRLGSNEK